MTTRNYVAPRATPGTPIIDRIMARVDTSGDCWDYLGAKCSDGYGRLTVKLDGRVTSVRAYRVTYEAFVGPIPDGLEIDHLCRRPQCVRPDHLEPVTPAENMRRTRRDVCKRAGHPLTDDNLYVKTNGSRQCRLCTLANVRRNRAGMAPWTNAEREPGEL